MKDFAKAGWKAAPLSQVAQIRPNKKEAKSVLADNDEVSFVPMDCLKVDQVALAEHEARPLGKVYGGYTYFRDGDVLLAKITPCFENGKLGIANDLTNSVGFGSSEFFVLRPREELVAGYLYHFLNRQSFRDWAKGRMTGAVGHKRVPKELVEALEIPLPPLEEQQRIVELLDEAFEELARARAHAEANLQNARELVATSTDALCSEVSEGWQHGTMGDFCKFEGGFAFKSVDTVKESQVQLIRIGNLYQNVLDLDRKPVFYPNEFADTYKKFRLNTGDIILSLTGTVGKQDYGFAVEVPDTNRALLLNQRVARIMPKDAEKLAPQFLLRFLRSASFLSMLYNISRGTRQANLSTRDMANLPMAVPPMSKQLEIVGSLDSIDASSVQLIAAYERSIVDVDDLRQSLLQKAFAGELT